MLESVIVNLIAMAISGAIAWLFKLILRSLKAKSVSNAAPSTRYSKTLLWRQFLISEGVMILLLVLAALFPPSDIGAKFTLFLFAGFTFIFADGAFEAAMSCYPSDNVPTEPSQQGPDNTAGKSAE